MTTYFSRISKIQIIELVMTCNDSCSKMFLFQNIISYLNVRNRANSPRAFFFGSELENPSSESKVMMISRLRWRKKCVASAYAGGTRSLFAVTCSSTSTSSRVCPAPGCTMRSREVVIRDTAPLRSLRAKRRLPSLLSRYPTRAAVETSQSLV